MAGLFTATSYAADGSMYDATHPDDETIQENRRQWCRSLGISYDSLIRVSISYEKDDFCVYREVGEDDRGLGVHERPEGHFADALVTRTPHVTLFLPVADCIATVLYDARQQIVMLSHLGRHSLEQDGGYKSVRYLIETYGSRLEDIEVRVSPAPSKESYTIHALDDKGMKETLFEQLKRVGIFSNQIHDNPAETDKDGRYYSHSAFLRGEQSEDGRYAVVARLT